MRRVELLQPRPQQLVDEQLDARREALQRGVGEARGQPQRLERERHRRSFRQRLVDRVVVVDEAERRRLPRRDRAAAVELDRRRGEAEVMGVEARRVDARGDELQRRRQPAGVDRRVEEQHAVPAGVGDDVAVEDGVRVVVGDVGVLGAGARLRDDPQQQRLRRGDVGAGQRGRLRPRPRRGVVDEPLDAAVRELRAASPSARRRRAAAPTVCATTAATAAPPTRTSAPGGSRRARAAARRGRARRA